MNAAEIAIILEARSCGYGYRAKCPAHKDKHPSLWFSDAGGKLHFQCKAGCHYSDIRAALGLHGRMKLDSLPVAEERDPVAEERKRGQIYSTWERTVAIAPNSPTWRYLVHTRRVLRDSEIAPSVLRDAVDVRYYDQDGEFVDTFPAMMARLDAPDGSMVTIHRTYLTLDGQKAPVEKTKKLMASPYPGCTEGGAIRLYEPIDGVLGIAEGIETALACHTIFGIPVWAAWSSTGLAKAVLPEELTDLIIFADNDTAGLKAAGDLIRRLNAERHKLNVRLKSPDRSGADFADELLNQ